jgi:N-acetylmuramoyl-L-alanine amidase
LKGPPIQPRHGAHVPLFIPTVEQLKADHWTDRAGQKPVAIVVHGTGGTDSRGTLQHGDGRGVSIHALITKTGLIYEMVPDTRGANHAGAPTSSFTLNGRTYTGGQVNKATLGVELENLQDGRDPYPAAQLGALGWWIAQKRAAHGLIPLLRHAELDPTRRRDPYQLSTQTMEYWAAKYMSSPPPDPIAKRYRAKRIMISQRQEGGPPYAGELAPGEEVIADKWYTDNGGTIHLQDGRGFVLLADLESM